MKTRVLSVRIDSNLYADLFTGVCNKRQLVESALHNYLDIKGNNSSCLQNVDGLISVLGDQIKDLKNDKLFLQNQVNALTIVRYPWLSRIKLKLLTR